MAALADGQMRLDFGPFEAIASRSAAYARYRCPCRDCAFSLDEETNAADQRPTKIAHVLVFERKA